MLSRVCRHHAFVMHIAFASGSRPLSFQPLRLPLSLCQARHHLQGFYRRKANIDCLNVWQAGPRFASLATPFTLTASTTCTGTSAPSNCPSNTPLGGYIALFRMRMLHAGPVHGPNTLGLLAFPSIHLVVFATLSLPNYVCS